jgi:hypothetical protein
MNGLESFQRSRLDLVDPGVFAIESGTILFDPGVCVGRNKSLPELVARGKTQVQEGYSIPRLYREANGNTVYRFNSHVSDPLLRMLVIKFFKEPLLAALANWKPYFLESVSNPLVCSSQVS